MDFLKKLFNFQSLTEQRISQLKKEEKLDVVIEKSKTTCPDLTFQFLLKNRELNRKLSLDMYNTKLADYPTKVKTNLDLGDEFLDQYMTECPQNFCKNLPAIIARLDSVIKETKEVEG